MNRILKALGVEKRPDDYGGTYDAGWNDCIERHIQEPTPMKKGTAADEYRRGWNAARSRLLNLK